MTQTTTSTDSASGSASVTAGASAGATAAEFLAAHYAPAGTRLQVLLAHPVPAALDASTRDLVEARGLEPLRRVATLRPRPGESELRTDDFEQFLERYGHEYSAGWVSDGAGLDRERLQASAERVGCSLGWAV